jgi:ABC-type branched-subunit amino acid transport system ATPase component
VTPEDALVVDDLVVRFGGLVAVDHVSLDARVGRLTGLIGPNGAGKTTTFNGCSGMVRPTSGHIRLFGDDVTRLSSSARAQRGLGRTFQRMELCDSLTVAENVALGREGRFAGSSVIGQLVARRAEQTAVAEATAVALDLCDLTALARRRAGALSTGQRRLVELARVVAGGFRLLLLDEPSSGLDRGETERFGQVLSEIVRGHGAGILLVEHDMSLVLDVCAHIYVLEFGKLIFQGSPAEVAHDPVVRSAYLGEVA